MLSAFYNRLFNYFYHRFVELFITASDSKVNSCVHIVHYKFIGLKLQFSSLRNGSCSIIYNRNRVRFHVEELSVEFFISRGERT